MLMRVRGAAPFGTESSVSHDIYFLEFGSGADMVASRYGQTNGWHKEIHMYTLGTTYVFSLREVDMIIMEATFCTLETQKKRMETEKVIHLTGYSSGL